MKNIFNQSSLCKALRLWLEEEQRMRFMVLNQRQHDIDGRERKRVSELLKYAAKTDRD